jgi:hypothetical protein
VLYTDSTSSLDYTTTGYKEYGANPDSCPTCDPIYRIGTLTSLGTVNAGLIDSNGDVYLTEGGLTIVRFQANNDFLKSTVLTVTASDYQAPICSGTGGAATSNYITDIKLSYAGEWHVLTSGYKQCNYQSGQTATAYTGHIVYDSSFSQIGLNKIARTGAVSCGSETTINGKAKLILPEDPYSNMDVIIADTYYLSCYPSGSAYKPVTLVRLNGSNATEICPTNCAGMLDLSGAYIYSNYVYLSSPNQGYVYRYATNYSAQSGVGFAPGSFSQASGLVEYATKDIDVPAAAYYNDSRIPINYDLRFIIPYENFSRDAALLSWGITVTDPSGLTNNFDINALSCSQVAPWWISLISNPINSWLGVPLDPYQCTSSGSKLYTLDSGEVWTNGTYRVDLIEQYLTTRASLDYDTWSILNVSWSGAGGFVDAPGRRTTGIPDTPETTGLKITELLQSPVFWGLVFIVGLMIMVATYEQRGR